MATRGVGSVAPNGKPAEDKKPITQLAKPRVPTRAELGVGSKPDAKNGAKDDHKGESDPHKTPHKTESLKPEPPKPGDPHSNKAPPRTLYVSSRYKTPTGTRPPLIQPEKKPPPKTPLLTIPLTHGRKRTPERNTIADRRSPTKSIVSTPRPTITSTTTTTSVRPNTTAGGKNPAHTTIPPRPSTTTSIKKPPSSPTKAPPKTDSTAASVAAKLIAASDHEKTDMIQQLNNKIAQLQKQLQLTAHERDSLHSQLQLENASEESELSNWDGSSLGSFDGNSENYSENSSEIGDERDEKYLELVKRYRTTLTTLLSKVSLFKNALSNAKGEYDALREQYDLLVASQSPLTDVDRIRSVTNEMAAIAV